MTTVAPKMKILLLGSTDLTLAVAEALLAMGLPPVGVVSVGRSFQISYQADAVRNVRFADMATWCAARGIAHFGYDGPDSLAVGATATGAECSIAAGWYHMLPARVRTLFPMGCFGLHPSLLPAYRGGAPLNWAMLNAEAETGVSLYGLGDGVDDGPLYGQRRFPLHDDDYIADVLGRAQAAAVDLLRECLPRIVAGDIVPVPQVGSPSYGLQRHPDDGRIDWSRPAASILRLIRAVSRPYPGAFGVVEGAVVRIWRARLAGEAASVWGACGQIARVPGFDAPLVVTGDGLLAIQEAEDQAGDCAMERLRQWSQRRFSSG